MMNPLQPLPDSFVSTREALHRVAEELVAPARKPDNEIALRQVPGGFGTPPFEFEGARIPVHVEGAGLVVDRDGETERIPLTSLSEAGAKLGSALLPDGVPSDAGPLEIDPGAAERLGDFYAFADEVLRELRETLPTGDVPSDINLWPEHFDIAFEAGDEGAGKRANYGASPGDEGHDEPYLYVGPWTAQVEGELWDAAGFNGAELSYSDLVAADDQKATALEFFTARHAALSG
jgi:hypothetical protein